MLLLLLLLWLRASTCKRGSICYAHNFVCTWEFGRIRLHLLHLLLLQVLVVWILLLLLLVVVLSPLTSHHTGCSSR